MQRVSESILFACDHQCPNAANLRLAVVIASTGRPDEIAQLLRQLKRQTFPPAAIIISVSSVEDLPGLEGHDVIVIMGKKGLTVQRNRGIEAACRVADIAVFYDDDFLPANDALAGVARLFASDERIVGATGEVLCDGIKTGGLDYNAALACLNEFSRRDRRGHATISETDELYGCNMAFRLAALGPRRFDERLPLYGWQEDVDFAGQLLTLGRVVKTDGFAGVHRGVVGGRSAGRRLGVSQILNPVYLVRKGTMRPTKALKIVLRNLAANHARAFWPESYVDRLGRVGGNWLGIWYLLTGRSQPEQVLSVKP
jgi:GT2 family glycosyltransferase